MTYIVMSRGRTLAPTGAGSGPAGARARLHSRSGRPLGSTTQCGTVLCSAMWCCTPQHSTIKRGTARDSTALHGVAWRGAAHIISYACRVQRAACRGPGVQRGMAKAADLRGPPAGDGCQQHALSGRRPGRVPPRRSHGSLLRSAPLHSAPSHRTSPNLVSPAPP